MLDGIGRNRNRPQLARDDLWEGARRLAPSPPIKFCIGDKRSNFCVSVAFRVFAGAAFLPEVVNRAGPPAIGQRTNAYFGIEDVLPKGIDVTGIGHQGTQTNDGNGTRKLIPHAIAQQSNTGPRPYSIGVQPVNAKMTRAAALVIRHPLAGGGGDRESKPAGM